MEEKTIKMTDENGVKLTIRNAQVSDAAAILEIYHPYVEHTAVTFDYDLPPLAEMERRIVKHGSEHAFLVAELNGDVVGYAYASEFKGRAAYQWAVETSIYISMEHHHKGIGKQLLNSLEDRLFKQGIMNFNACISYIDTEDEYLNQDSVRFHESMGYRKCAHFHRIGKKFDRWYDMIWMEKLF